MLGQGDHQFKTEIALLSKYKHENIVSLLGFCDEEGEKILVYKFESNGSLDRHLNNKDLINLDTTTVDLPRCCLWVKHWKAKISDFGLSKVRPANMQASFLFSKPGGTEGYIDPDYGNNGYLTQKSDVSSFGVVLWEVLCGRLTVDPSYNDERRCLTVLAKMHYRKKTLNLIIPSGFIQRDKQRFIT
ncbi:putative protein kinase RLK-Pelle-CrRLK1L-1 family [Helianthus annuus]|nr:putative protein kinase RLK-Pelle-CrRLK1L-1 family [Helianthus annuus]